MHARKAMFSDSLLESYIRCLNDERSAGPCKMHSNNLAYDCVIVRPRLDSHLEKNIYNLLITVSDRGDCLCAFYCICTSNELISRTNRISI